MRNMKGFLNKNAKIMWENTPAQPEFSSDKIVAAVASASEELFENEDFQAGLTAAVENVIENDVDLEDLANVGGYTPEAGKILIYDGSEAWWRPTDPYYPSYWQQEETLNVTAENEGATIRYTIPASTTRYCKGFFVRCNLAQAASGAGGSFGIVAEFGTGGTVIRRSIGDLAASIVETGAGVVCGMYTGDNQLFLGWISQRTNSVSANAQMTFRPDSVHLATGEAVQINTIEFRTQTSGAVIPAGTTIEIYTLRSIPGYYQ